MSIKLPSFIKVLLVISTLFPITVLAYLGQFSRMMSDDYCNIAIGLEYGSWGGMVYRYENWGGNYSSLFFRFFLAPLEELMPSIMPIILIMTWLVMLIWLFYQLCTLLNIESRGMISVVLGCLTLFVTINGFHSMQAFYWYTAMVEYTFPLPLLTGMFAAIVYATLTIHKPIWVGLTAVVIFVVSFLIGGFAESNVAFQVTLSVLMVGFVVFFLAHVYKRNLVLLLTASGLGAILSLIVQLVSPGLSQRFATELSRTNRAPFSLFNLIQDTLSATLKYTSDRYILGGFAVILIITIVTVFLFYRPQFTASAEKPLKLPMIPTISWVILQLLYVPFLWTHMSDSPQILERFSYLYFAVIILNILFILLGLSLIILHRRINQWIENNPKHLILTYLVISLFWGMLLGVTQVARLDERVIQFIVYSLLSLLVLFILHLATAFTDPAIKRFAYSSVILGLFVLILSASVLSTSIFGTGVVVERILPAISFIMPLFAIVCGFVLSVLIKLLIIEDRLPMIALAPYVMTAYALGVAIIIGGSVISYMQLSPNLKTYADGWQDRHDYILEQRDLGHTSIEVTPLSFHLEDIIKVVTLAQDPANRCSEQYYGVQSIEVSSS
jgi:hypothetical protein